MSSKTKKESKKISSSVSVVDNEPLVTPHTVVKTSAMVDTTEPVAEKKKRGRKKQNVVLEVGEAVVEEIIKPPPKKRGRKPKTPQPVENVNNVPKKRGRKPKKI